MFGIDIMFDKHLQLFPMPTRIEMLYFVMESLSVFGVTSQIVDVLQFGA